MFAIVKPQNGITDIVYFQSNAIESCCRKESEFRKKTCVLWFIY